MSFVSVLSLFGGLALFLFGMRLMGEGLQQAAGPKLKHFLALMTRNRFIAMLTGLCVTAIVQSSGATTVMVVGFVNARMLSLAQSVGVILGANIGTTVTSLLLSVKFDPGAVFAFVGMLTVMLMEKKETGKQIGYVFMGLGILFTGMHGMSAAMEPLKDVPQFQSMMLGVQSPVLGVLVGVIITALLQSSSVSVGIIQMMTAAGLLSLSGAMYLVLGAQIGACTPTLLAMANTNANAKRAAMIHLLFNVIKTALILTLSLFLPIADWFERLVPNNPKLCISCMHIGFNLFAVLVMLPCSDVLVRLSRVVIRGTDREENAVKLLYYDKHLLKTPSLAAEQLYKETCRMGREAYAHLMLAMDALQRGDLSHRQEMQYHEELSDHLEEAITEGLVDVMALELSDQTSHRVAGLFHVVTDLERISDHADNIFGLADESVEKKVTFSDKANAELTELFRHVVRVVSTALEGLEEWNMTNGVMALLENEEQTVDDLTETLRNKHIDRLKERKCTPKIGVIYLEVLHNLERVSDHAMNIAAISRNEISTHNHLIMPDGRQG